MNRKEEIKKFSLVIEKISKEKKISYIDAIIYHCETTGLEVEVAAKSISQNLKSKIKSEAEDLNMMKEKNRAKLPL